MSSNSFGNLFRITTWGESHGKGIGVVIDGCPAGIAITEDEINQALLKRAPGQNPFTSPRKEPDVAEIYSGVFEGKTTGAPVSIVIHNRDADSSKYEPIKHLMRPGHANYTYLNKYGSFDYRGGGRSSARETACRVAASVLAKKLLQHHGIEVLSYLHSVNDIETPAKAFDDLKTSLSNSTIFAADEETEQKMMAAIEVAKSEGDSLGGIVAFEAINLPIGLGDPVYEKLEANLAKAMMSMPASKGFEIGEGFACTRMKGSTHNDQFTEDESVMSSNHAGGTLGGISNGMPLLGRVAFKPTSSITQSQQTIDDSGQKAEFNLPQGSRHDPCVAIRAVPVVEAMLAIVLADALLMNRVAKL